MKITDPEPLLRSAQVLGNVLLAICLGLLVALPALIVWFVRDMTGIGAALAWRFGYPEAVLRDGQILLLGLVSLVHLAVWAAIVWQGRQIFVALNDHDTRLASDAARRTATLLWIMLVWSIASHALGTVITTWHFAQGERAVSVTIGAAQLQTLLAALLASFIAKAFVLGAALWQDHREVI